MLHDVEISGTRTAARLRRRADNIWHAGPAHGDAAAGGSPVRSSKATSFTGASVVQMLDLLLWSKCWIRAVFNFHTSLSDLKIRSPEV